MRQQLSSVFCPLIRRDGRAAEGARLEIVYTLIAYRGFESLSLRHSFSPETRYGVMSCGFLLSDTYELRES